MSLQTFFDNFALLADAPNGVVKLRELTLQLAVRGKLLPQSERDEPASLLLAKIKAQEKGLVKKKEIREPKSLPIIEADELPYPLPSSWEWVRLGEVGQIVGGGTPSTEHPEYYADDGIAWLTPADLYKLKGKFIGKGKKSISTRGLEKSSAQLMPAGTVLFSSRAPIGYVAIAANALTTNQGFKSCVPFVAQMNEYLYYFLKAVAKRLDEAASGTTFKEVPSKQFRLVLLPLPPLKEQKRIVAKVDELMRLCDELEARQQARRESRVRLNNATLAPLNNTASITPEEFGQASVRLADNFAALYDSAATVGKLRSTILQLAVQGKLVSQDPHDEPLEDIIVRAKKQRIALDLSIKERERILKEFENAEKAFQANKKRIDIAAICVCDFITKGTTPANTKLSTSGDVPFLKVYNIVNNRINFFYKPSYISKSTHEGELKRSKVIPGDVLMNIVGPPLGKVAIVPEDFEEWNMNQALAVFRSLQVLDREFLFYALSCHSILESVLSETKGTAGQDNLSLEQCRSIKIPLYPLEEQKRIVTKVNQLMALCDELETKLRQTEADSEKLMKAAVRDLLASITNEQPSIGQDKSLNETAMALSST